MAFTPQLLPSGQHPFPAFRRQDWPPSINRLTWRLARHVDRFNLTALLNSERRKLGLNAIGDAWRHILGPRVVVASDRAIARVPQLIIPHVLDQFYWGHQVYKSGLGPRPIWRSRLNVRKLKSTLRQCTTDAMLGQTAQSVASRIEPRESVERAVDTLLRACR